MNNNGYGNMGAPTSYYPYPHQASMPQNMAGMPQQNMASMAQQMRSMPQQMGSIPQQMASMPQQMANMPQQMASMPQQMASMPQQMASMRQQMANMPQQMASMPQQMASMPQQMANMPQQMASMPQQMTDMSQQAPATTAAAPQSKAKYERVSLVKKGCDCHRNNGLDTDCRCQPKQRTAMTLPAQPKQEQPAQPQTQFRRFEHGITPPTPRSKPVTKKPVTLAGTDAGERLSREEHYRRTQEQTLAAHHQQQNAGQASFNVHHNQQATNYAPSNSSRPNTFNGLEDSKWRSGSPEKATPVVRSQPIAANAQRRRDPTTPPWALHSEPPSYDHRPLKRGTSKPTPAPPAQLDKHQNQAQQQQSPDVHPTQQHHASETSKSETIREPQQSNAGHQVQANVQQQQQLQQQTPQSYTPHHQPANENVSNQPSDPYQAYAQHQNYIQRYQQQQPTASLQQASLVNQYTGYAQQPGYQEQVVYPSPQHVGASMAYAQQLAQPQHASHALPQQSAQAQTPHYHHHQTPVHEVQQQTPQVHQTQALAQQGQAYASQQHPPQTYSAPANAPKKNLSPQVYSPQAYAQKQQAYGVPQQPAQAYQTQAYPTNNMQAFEKHYQQSTGQSPVPPACQIHLPQTTTNSVDDLVYHLNKKCSEEEEAIASYFQQKEAMQKQNPTETTYQQGQAVEPQHYNLAQQEPRAVPNNQQAMYQQQQQVTPNQQYMQHHQAAEPCPNPQVVQQYQGYGNVQQQHGAGEHPSEEFQSAPIPQQMEQQKECQAAIDGHPEPATA